MLIMLSRTSRAATFAHDRPFAAAARGARHGNDIADAGVLRTRPQNRTQPAWTLTKVKMDFRRAPSIRAVIQQSTRKDHPS
jgi:hypothetical protein